MMIATPEEALRMAADCRVDALLLLREKDGTITERSTPGFKKYTHPSSSESNYLSTLLATIIIFASVMAILYWVIRRHGSHQCSCKQAARIMQEKSQCESCDKEQ